MPYTFKFINKKEGGDILARGGGGGVLFEEAYHVHLARGDERANPRILSCQSPAVWKSKQTHLVIWKDDSLRLHRIHASCSKTGAPQR